MEKYTEQKILTVRGPSDCEYFLYSHFFQKVLTVRGKKKYAQPFPVRGRKEEDLFASFELTKKVVLLVVVARCHVSFLAH
jgi:hypothetical protein